jgi:hypothetical protein
MFTEEMEKVRKVNIKTVLYRENVVQFDKTIKVLQAEQGKLR